MSWLCPKCGYVHESEQPPMYCPICQAPSDDFVENNAENQLLYAHLSVDL